MRVKPLSHVIDMPSYCVKQRGNQAKQQHNLLPKCVASTEKPVDHKWDEIGHQIHISPEQISILFVPTGNVLMLQVERLKRCV